MFGQLGAEMTWNIQSTPEHNAGMTENDIARLDR